MLMYSSIPKDREPEPEPEQKVKEKKTQHLVGLLLARVVAR